MQVAILERNKLVGRKLARWFMATGASVATLEDPAGVPGLLGGVHVLCADTFDGDLVVEQIRARPGRRGVLWTAEPLRRSLRYLVETAEIDPRDATRPLSIDHVLGRRDFESPPPAREVAMLARRLQGVPAPPLGAYLDWGFTALEIEVRATADRDAAAARIQDFVGALQVPRRFAGMIAELGHELIMNAMYGAPVDGHGRPRYAGDRKADIVSPSS